MLETDGMQYVITNSQIILQVVSGLLKATVLLLTENLILMQLFLLCDGGGAASLCHLYAKRHYKWLDFKAQPDHAAISQKNSVLVHQVSGMVFNNTDIILLSFLTDFNTVSIYYIYNLFFSQVEVFINGLVKGLQFRPRSAFSLDKEAFIKKFRTYESLFVASNFVVYTAMCLFLLPIIQIYTGGINDADYINPRLFCFLWWQSFLPAPKRL